MLTNVFHTIDMNYVSAVYGVLIVIIATDWLARGGKSFRGQAMRHEEVDNPAHNAATLTELTEIDV